MNVKPAIKPEVKKIQAEDTRKPTIKIRAHFVCIILAISLTVIVPQLIHSQLVATATLFAPNFLQEIIDRLLHL